MCVYVYIYKLHIYEKVRDPTCTKSSETGGVEFYKTYCARDEVMHLGGFKGHCRRIRRADV